ncbi:hypothetical protein F4680DRAFT_442509 [Xylaria scruposa]|nr:hypothetical protein F4680DRAFT_442509 [Xylaria scruposa]
MVFTKGKGTEPVAATWPAPSDLNSISPRKPIHRPRLSKSIFAKPETTQHSSQASNNTPLAEGSHHDGNHSSNTWTSSSENPNLPSEDGKDDREHFILEYNRLAQRHGIRPIVPGDFSPPADHIHGSLSSRRGSWLSNMLRQSSGHLEQAATKPDKISSRHQRRTSDVALDFVHGNKRDGLKNQDLRALVRFCGKSPLFLPTDYAPFSLTLPTCFRALAQALVQHVETKGIFRVSGSARVVNALYDYYCTVDNTEAISSTTRCPTLPSHIRCNTHDIASTFKRLLAGLPGGILGSLSLFDALVAIHSQLQGDPEWHRTKESKLRARLIALAIGTVKSQYQRELICAVFGLLCLVGRVAKNAPREDENGRPLPTGDLMGYNALGIIFGPLLIGDMINSYSMKVANPAAGLVLLPVSSPRSRKEGRKYKPGRRGGRKHRKKPTPGEESSFSVDKIHIANSITEMLIVHWREVVRQIRSTGSVRTRRGVSNPYPEGVPTNIPLSISENFSFRNPPHWDHARRGSTSPSTVSLRGTSRTGSTSTINKQDSSLGQRTLGARTASISSSDSTQKLSMKAPPYVLSLTIEESPSPRVEAPKPSHGHQKAASDVCGALTHKAYPMTPSMQTKVIEAALSPSIKVHPPTQSSSSPISQTAPRHEHEAANFKSLHRTNTSKDEAEISEMNLNDVVVDGAGQSHTKIDRMTVSGRNSPSEPLRLHNSPHGDRPRNERLPKSITDPRLDEMGRSTSARLLGEEVLTRSPADQWRSLVASSKASTESLAKSAKERRLKRSVGNVSSRTSRESSSLAASRPTTPKRGEAKGQSKVMRPERKASMEETPHSIHPTLKARVERFSPEKYSSDTSPHRGSPRRSASKPVPGAVRAMAAFFDNAARDSPENPVSILSGRTLNSLRESSSSPYAVDRSPTKSHPPRNAAVPMKSTVRVDDDPCQRKPTLDRYSSTPEGLGTVRASPSRLQADTPTKSLQDTLRPVRTFSPSRKEAQSSPSKPTREIYHHSQPPRLGAMVPYQEEPPIGHFVRPSSSTSAQSRNVSAEPPLESRHTSGTSFLHAQIRSLQRQLEMKNEEILHLRRQLETQEHMDIGTLSEQLRVAKRECMMWRKRAETAERRVAVFQRFGSRFQALTDGIDELEGRPLSYSMRKENRATFKNHPRLGGADGVVFEDRIDDDVSVGRKYELRRGRSWKEVDLWDAAQELMDFQHGGSMHV